MEILIHLLLTNWTKHKSAKIYASLYPAHAGLETKLYT